MTKIKIGHWLKYVFILFSNGFYVLHVEVATGSNEEMSVNVQPEGMSGVVNDGIAVDSDEKIIIVSIYLYCILYLSL